GAPILQLNDFCLAFAIRTETPLNSKRCTSVAKRYVDLRRFLTRTKEIGIQVKALFKYRFGQEQCVSQTFDHGRFAMSIFPGYAVRSRFKRDGHSLAIRPVTIRLDVLKPDRLDNHADS